MRDTIGWFGDTINAKGQRDSLRRQNAALRRKLVADQAEKRSLRELQSIYHVDQLGVGLHPVTATVVGNAQPLVRDGHVDAGSTPGSASMTPSSTAKGSSAPRWPPTAPGSISSCRQLDGVSARLAERRTGIARSRSRRPGSLLLRYLPSTTADTGEYVVSTVTSPDDSLYPPGLLIGRSSRSTKKPGSSRSTPRRQPAEPRPGAGADLGASSRAPHGQPRDQLPAARTPRRRSSAEQVRLQRERPWGRPRNAPLGAAPRRPGAADAFVRVGASRSIFSVNADLTRCGRLRGAAVRLDDRRHLRLRDRPPDRPAAAQTLGPHRWRLHADRLLERPCATARPAGGAHPLLSASRRGRLADPATAERVPAGRMHP